MRPERRNYHTSEAYRLAVAEWQLAQATAAAIWFWVRVVLCVLSIPVCALWLYACAYL